MGSREEQKELRRMEILQVGLDLFVRKGYAATKISDIANAANMSVGLLFHYFESKEKLYEELVKMGLQGTRMTRQMVYSNAISFFEEFTKQIFESMKKQPWIAKMFVLMAQAQQSEGTPDSVRKIAAQVNTIELSIEIIKEGQEDGTIRQGNPIALSIAFWCSVQGIAEYIASNPEMPFPEVEWIVDIIRKDGRAL